MDSLIIDKRLSDKLLSEWHPTKNENINSNEITYGSYEYIWWICSEGHEWGATPGERLKKNEECPKCLRLKKAEQKTEIKEARQIKSLQDIDPELAKQWHPTKNEISSEDVLFEEESNYIIYRWWKCKRNHEWKESIKSRHNNQSACPYCSNKIVCEDNCFAAVYPEIAKEWFIFKNDYNQKSKTPYDALYTTNEEVYWICKEGHIWLEKANLRVKNGKGCRKCEKYQQSIALLNPEIAKEWHPTKNKGVYGITTPEETSTRCNERIWWLCGKCGNEYKAMVKARHEGTAKCNVCYPPETTGRTTSTKRKGEYHTARNLEDQRIIFENKLRENLSKND
ncbi:zinc-ribbon domain-containing protein [Bacillus sp. NPDC094106]|uniref:zinc-ribbon domain-containing protein n=1 Tax=Bacillus sp. NPDC094106 TaxID=3363949 RepID=UPI00381756AB